MDRPSSPTAGAAPLDAVVGALPDGVVVVGGDGTVRHANPAALRLLGWHGPAGALPDLRAFELRSVGGDPLGPAERPSARALAGERFDGVDCLFVGADGVERRVRCAGGPLELAGGERGAWVGFRDVSAEEAILRELRDERDLVAALVAQSPLAIAVARAPGMVVELANDIAVALRPETPMVGRRVAELFPEAGPAGFLDMLDSVAATGEAFSVTDAPIEWLGPGVRYFSMTYSRLPQPPGRPTRVLIMARETTAEVTVRSRAEEIAAERSRDLSRARVTSSRLRSLVDLAAATGQEEDLDALLQLVTGEACRLLGADSAVLFLLDERGDELVGRAQVGLADDVVVGVRVAPSQWPDVGELLRTGRPVVHARAGVAAGPERSYAERFAIRSSIAVRLGGPGRPLGAMFVNYSGRRHRFSGADLAFVETLTSYLSVTIERARLVSVLREAVGSLQTALLPDAFPEVRGLDVAALYRSASEVAQVGGDFYDLFPLADGRVAAVIGDICGKGVAAARHTVRLRYELRAQLEEQPTPGRALAAFNRRVVGEFADDEYATLLVVTLDPATGAATWASAGHPPPVLARPVPRQLAFDGSLPAGLFPTAGYRTARFTLPPGGCLVLYTDGVVEARSADGHELGVEGLIAAVPAVHPSAGGVADAVLKDVLRHTGGRLDDDAALLVICRSTW